MKTEGKPSDNTNSPHKNSSEPRESKGKTNVSPSLKIDNRYPDLTVFIMRVRRYSVNMSAHRYTLRTTRHGMPSYYLFKTHTCSVTDRGGGKGGGERERERERERWVGEGVTGRRMDDVDKLRC